MLDFERVGDLLSGLTLLKFFPSDDGARLELAKLVARMCSTEDQVEWLVQRTLALWTEWEGPRELRAILCSKFKPADNIEAFSSLARFADGIPSELQIEAPTPPELSRGEPVSVNPELERTIWALAVAKEMEHVRDPGTVRVPDIPVNPDFKPITAADIPRKLEQERRQTEQLKKNRDGVADPMPH